MEYRSKLRFEKVYKLVFVIGNGFDMDLNLKTSYKSFLESKDFTAYTNEYILDTLKEEARIFRFTDKIDRENFPLLQAPSSIFNVLKAKATLENWYDVEKQLALIAYNQNSSNRINKAKLLDILPISSESYYQLHTALHDYLSFLSYDNIATGSIAYKLFQVLNRYPTLVHVKSFNYTDLNQIFSGKNNLSVDHIHGKLSENSLIIGIQDDLDINPSYNYMIKSFSEHFRSHNLIYDLEDADEVIFFGHSLGETDYHYFQDFFQKQTEKSRANKDLRLSIFTYDHKSRMDILQQLRNMNNKKTDMLFALCDFQLFMTKEECNDRTRIDNFLGSLDCRLKDYIES